MCVCVCGGGGGDKGTKSWFAGRGEGQGSLGPTHTAGPAMTKFDQSCFCKHDKKHPGR